MPSKTEVKFRTIIITSMVRRLSWRTCFFSETRITPLSSNRKFHYRVYNSPTLVPILSHIHAVRPDFLKIHFNIILLSMPTSSKKIISLRYHNQNHVSKFSFSHACHMSHQSNYYTLEGINIFHVVFLEVNYLQNYEYYI